MTSAAYPNDELRTLADAACDGSLSDEAALRLEKILRGNPEAQRYYLTHVRLDGCLRWEFGNPAQEQSMPLEKASGADIPAAGAAVELLNRIVLKTDDSSAPFPSLVVSPLSSPSSPPFVGGPVFSYMVASMVLCMMLIGAWAYKITHDARVATNRPAPSLIDKDNSQLVARITGMKECQWPSGVVVPVLGSYVTLERKYSLDAGLLEITYKSGARVILEGPCVYEVDSTAGGYLRRGKLTARIEKRETRREKRKERSGGLVASAASAKPQAANPQSPAPSPQFPKSSSSPLFPLPSPLFTVSTPTAIVTDLGTEFGVEVKEDGETQVHVFQGKVEAEWFGLSGTADRIVELTAGQAAGFDHNQSAIVLFPTRPRDFVRAVPGPPTQPIDVAAKKTIVHWSGVYRYGDSSKGTSDWTTLERFGTHHVNDGITDETDVGRAYWLGREQTADEFFVIFLRGRYSVEKLELMNTHNGPGNDRGTKDFEIWAAEEVDTENKLVSPRLVLKGTLPCRFGAGANIPYDVFTAEKGDFERFNARYVKFVAKTFYENENKGFGGCGLNEIRLFATPAGAEKE